MTKGDAVSRFFSKKITRREFLKYGAIGIGGITTGVYGFKYLLRKQNRGEVFSGDAPETLSKWSKEASYFKRFDDGVECQLCPRACYLEIDDRGACRARVNKDNTLYTVAYGNPAAVHVDPIEKKPLFHFLPETGAFSIATGGCNLRCLNCQNWDLSQSKPDDLRNHDLLPEATVKAAIKNNCDSIAYTYSEPTVFYEYMMDTAKIAKDSGIKNVWITAGYINEEPLRELCKYIDAANIDLKGFSDDTYQRLNAGNLQAILDTMRILKEEGIWIEITNLVVPTWTDDLSMINEMSEYLVKNGYSGYPLHFSRFSPQYKLAYLPPTPVSTLESAREIAMKAGMKYVYIGNVPGHESESTYCPKCRKVVIGRKGYKITEKNIKNGVCTICGEKIEGVWKA